MITERAGKRRCLEYSLGNEDHFLQWNYQTSVGPRKSEYSIMADDSDHREVEMV